MKSLNKEKVSRKENSLLISPSWFIRRDIKERRRTKEDVLLCGMLWLDNDGDGISDRDFSYIFNDIKFLVYETYSSTKKKRRYRVCIPLIRPVLPTEYETLIQNVFDMLDYNGWNFDGKGGKKKHGFDKMGSLTTSLLYLPCTPVSRKTNYFKQYKDNRTILDPDNWLDNPLKPDVEVVNITSNRLAAEADIFDTHFKTYSGDHNESIECLDNIEVNRAMAIWNMQKGRHGVGHKAFWTLALHLTNAGMDEEALRAVLFERPKRHAL